MMNILKDESKFVKLGPAVECDGTARIEGFLQHALRELNKNGEIPDAVYKNITPTGSIRPRLYGVPEVHKDNVPLRPILSMVGSPQDVTAKWLAEILKPVLSKLGKHTIKDSFKFNNTIRSTTMPRTGHLCSFDIKSLFTCVPLEETFQVAVQHLYHSDIEPPRIKEASFIKLVRKVTAGVEFIFNDTMFQQKDGVVMGSPLGPVLANIFVGHCEERLDLCDNNVLFWKRYVDDTFALTTSDETAKNFQKVLQPWSSHRSTNKMVGCSCLFGSLWIYRSLLSCRLETNGLFWVCKSASNEHHLFTQ